MLKTVVQSILRRSQQINKTNLKFYSVYQNKAMADSKDDSQVDKFLSDVFQLCMRDVVQFSRERSNPVIKFKTPEQLLETIDYSLSKEGCGNEKLLELCEKVVEHSQKTGHPYFFNQMYGGTDPYGLAGNIIVDSLNTNGHTFEVSPAFSVAEKVLVDHLKSYLNYQGDGTFCPGGSYCGLLAMASARTAKFPDIRQKGTSNLPRMQVFCSDQAHYSAQKNSMVLGIGLENCLSVKSDDKGKMIVEELEKAVEKAKNDGCVPLMVIATAGTTVLGAFDDFNKISQICNNNQMWMHVDGAWGGSALVSNKYRHLLDGCEKADSFAWNPHKLLGAPIQSSVLLFREKDMLRKSQSTEVKYLFQNDKPYDMQYDLGRNLLQCGRSCDAFKLWVMWKAWGNTGMEKRVENAWSNAEFLLGEIKRRGDRFKLVMDEIEGPNVCFWWVPKNLRSSGDTPELRQKLAEIVPQIKVKLQKSGEIMIGYSPAGDYPTFFRMVLVNMNVVNNDMTHLLDRIEQVGEDITK